MGLVSLGNMDNQPAETWEKYSTENVGGRQGDVRLVPVRALGDDALFTVAGKSMEKWF